MTDFDPVRFATFDRLVGQIARPLIAKSAVALRAAGPEILAEDEPEKVEVSVQPSWWWSGSAASGMAGWINVSVEVILDDDWSTEVADRGWALIGDHFVLRVTEWSDGAEPRPQAVIALRVVEPRPELFLYVASEAVVTYPDDNVTLEFGRDEVSLP